MSRYSDTTLSTSEVTRSSELDIPVRRGRRLQVTRHISYPLATGPKGTEAPVVILVHASDNVPDGLPAGKYVDEALRGAIDSNVNHYAEERRLFYVAMTRIKEQFHTVAKSGRISRYLHDIQNDYFDRIDHDLSALTGDVFSI